jgi:hypothetical protein
MNSSLYFPFLSLLALGFLEVSLNVLGLGFYPNKTKELGFMRTLGAIRLTLGGRREGRCLAWSHRVLLV